MVGMRVSLIAAIAAVGLSLALSSLVSADDTDTQFIGAVSFFLPHNKYLDPATINALIADATKVCAMSDAGFSYEAMEFINSKWDPSDVYGFMGAATRAYCPQHRSDWAGV
jgi:hypothetical protein